MKSWDVIVVGGGIIGLSLAIELRKAQLTVLVVERGELGREASWAAGGMLADCGLEIPGPLLELAHASARMYPEFVHQLQDESGQKIDFRSDGTILFPEPAHAVGGNIGDQPPAPLNELEPSLRPAHQSVLYLKENSVDPRGLAGAAVAAAKHRGVDFSSGDEVVGIDIAEGRVSGVTTAKTQFSSGIVVNCAGAWAGQIGPQRFPTRPVKGQMLCVVMPRKDLLRHVVRTPDVYLIPRSDGRLLIGATLEDAGYNKQTVPETIQKLRRAALDLLPQLREARILEAWAGLRPGTPDHLPILGATHTPGYFVATGHYRDGILLAPVTAQVMAQVITGQPPAFDLGAFAAERFAA